MKTNLIQRRASGGKRGTTTGTRGNEALAREKLRDQHHRIGGKDDIFVPIGWKALMESFQLVSELNKRSTKIHKNYGNNFYLRNIPVFLRLCEACQRVPLPCLSKPEHASELKYRKKNTPVNIIQA